MSDQVTEVILDENEQILVRKQKLTALRKESIAFPNDFKRDHLAQCLHASYETLTPDQLDSEGIAVSLGGRMMTRRLMGKASFVHLQDMSGQIQLYFKKDTLPEGNYDLFKTWDIGDIIGVKGVLFKTKTGELSVKVTEARLLTKALRPLPDKFHGLQDEEVRLRKRYLEMIMDPELRQLFSTGHLIPIDS